MREMHQRLDVHPQHRLQLFPIGRVKFTVIPKPRVVDQQVRRQGFFLQIRNQRRTLIPTRKVRHQHDDLAGKFLPDPLRQILQHLTAPRHQHQAPHAWCELQGKLLTQAR